MRRVIWTDPAIADLDGIRTYVGQFSPLAAQRLAARLIGAANSLVDFPNRGRIALLGTRELVFVRPYLIRYRVEDPDLVFVLRVRHGAMRPDSFEEEAGVFDEIDEEAERLADARAEADAEAGRVLPHEQVAAWLKTWESARSDQTEPP
jgi:plasmid stabilization system protein ParE